MVIGAQVWTVFPHFLFFFLESFERELREERRRGTR